MASRIGSDLRRARTRREIELSEVEAATRIRVRFLRAIEEEEWDALPGGVYTRGFIRTYAAHLGLDGERLAADFRREVEGASGDGPRRELAPVAASSATGSPGGRRSLSHLRWLAVPAVLLVAALAIVALPDGGGDGAPLQPQAPERTAPEAEQAAPVREPAAVPLRLSLAAKAEVWVCLLDADGVPLIEGSILAAGEEAGPFRSGSFTVSLGNGEVTMLVDGAEAEIPATSSPVGYAIDAAGELSELGEAERPTCV